MSLGSSELGSLGAELGTIELGGLGSGGGGGGINVTVTQTLTFTDILRPGVHKTASVTDTLVYVSSAVKFNPATYRSLIEGADYVAIYKAGAEWLTETRARVTMVEAGVVVVGSPSARVTAINTEVLGAGASAAARVTHITTEVLRLTRVAYDQSISQTLNFTQDPSNGAQYTRDVLSTLELSDAYGHAPGWIYNPQFTDILGLSDLGSKNHEATFLHSIIFTQSAFNTKALGGFQTLGITQTVAKQLVSNQAIAHTLTFTASTSYSHFGHPRDTLAFSQVVNTGFSFASDCESGTLGDNGLSYYYLGLDCGTGGPNGFVTDVTLTYTSTVKLKRVYSRKIVQTLTPTQTPTLGPWTRRQGITQTLKFLTQDYQKPIPIGTGGGTTITQPVLVGTKVQPNLVVIQSKNGAITLPAPQFDDSESLTNQVKITKVMSRKAYVYVKKSIRIKLSYEFLLGRRKAEEFREFFIANSAEDLTILNWKGETYFAKFGNNPLEFTTTGRFEYAFEKVTITAEFQGVRLNG